MNLQVLYWENQTKLVMSQDPDTILFVTRTGINIYNLLPYDVQILNQFRQNTTATVIDNLSLAPTIINAFIAGPPDVTKFPPVKSFDQFQEYLKNLKQLRWDVIRKMNISEEKKMKLLQGRQDYLSDDELFQLARSVKSEFMNIEYRNLDLTREDEYISQYQPETILVPTVRKSLELTNMEKSFLNLCKPHNMCVRKTTEPYWKDGIDFSTMNECVDYKLSALNAQIKWKKERQLLKDLVIKLPVGISFYEWKIRKENAAISNKKLNYDRCLAQFQTLVIDGNVKDLYIAQKIADEEQRMLQELKNKLNDFWNLQQEKLTISDGELFDLKMINPRCLPMVNRLLNRPQPEPKLTIEEQIEEEVSSEDWSGEWSVTSSLNEAE